MVAEESGVTANACEERADDCEGRGVNRDTCEERRGVTVDDCDGRGDNADDCDGRGDTAKCRLDPVGGSHWCVLCAVLGDADRGIFTMVGGPVLIVFVAYRGELMENRGDDAAALNENAVWSPSNDGAVLSTVGAMPRFRRTLVSSGEKP